MSTWSRKSLFALATFLVASLSVAGAAAAITLSDSGMRRPQSDVISVGYRWHYRGYYYDNMYDWATAYYDATWLHRGRRPPMPVRYVRDYYYVPDYYYSVLPEYVWVSPRRPSSCGEFHYWNGYCCVDARHFRPYVGPRW